jgi:predicted transcriptional regulator
MNKALVDLLERVRSWPESAQEELQQLARDIEVELSSGSYRATKAELAGIDRGLRDAADGKFATEQEIEATFSKYRRP